MPSVATLEQYMALTLGEKCPVSMWSSANPVGVCQGNESSPSTHPTEQETARSLASLAMTTVTTEKTAPDPPLRRIMGPGLPGMDVSTFLGNSTTPWELFRILCRSLPTCPGTGSATVFFPHRSFATYVGSDSASRSIWQPSNR
jgi:hypothetical protein